MRLRSSGRNSGTESRSCEKSRVNTDAENAALKSKVEDVESRLVKVEQDSSAEQPQNERNQKVASDNTRKTDTIDLDAITPGASMFEISQQLTQLLCDKALIAEEYTLETNQEEILCWRKKLCISGEGLVL
ncbi:hypothetical protein RhiirA4_471018 [Rhizophagus irregularis]|uniref:Uncharacterized protein n=1 Tax=Rhizophagus irregularis TaxID=588596 RepID=A0A2I1H2C3_9GLOM|nr:hypothetical protein RhiirA4_471018 [Rhizophagus irregularis]